jgi:hypothetical protein
MDKPRCRVCGEKHWSNEPHKLEDIVPTAAQRAEHSVRTNLELLSKIKLLEAENGLLKAKLARLELPKGDRKAYMREYMRKRRAKP